MRQPPTRQPPGAQFRAPRASSALRLLEAVGLAAGTVAAMLLLSYSLGTCVDVPKWHEKNYGFTLKCESGYNDLATAFMSFPDETIRHLFSLGSLTPQCAPAPGQPRQPRAAVRARAARVRARARGRAASSSSLSLAWVQVWAGDAGPCCASVCEAGRAARAGRLRLLSELDRAGRQ
jgi:hypothetical protein